MPVGAGVGEEEGRELEGAGVRVVPVGSSVGVPVGVRANLSLALRVMQMRGF